MKNTHNLRVSARTVELFASEDDDDGPPWQFSGIAVAAGDILHMDDGTPVLFTEEELRKAAETQAGEPLTVDHPADDNGRPVYPPPTEETIGKVPRAGWVSEAQAVGYEATTHDEGIADGVQAGSYEVSVHPSFELGETDPETSARIAKNISFHDLSVVSKGDSRSNTVEWGPNQALASLTADAIGSELTAATDSDTGTPGAGGRGGGIVRDTVRATLEAVGIEHRGTDTETTGAESSVDNDTTQNMDEPTRQQYVKFLTANADFDEESLTEMDDDVLEQTYELAAEGAAADADDNGGSTDNDDVDDGGDTTLAEMTVDELGSALRDQGFVTEDSIGDVADQVTAQATKSEKVTEIIANSDDYDDDDREDLMASADALVDREHDRITGAAASQIPGSAGLVASATPQTGSEDGAENPDDYGTGVAEH